MARKRTLTLTRPGPLTLVAGLAVAWLLTRIARKHGIGLRFQAIARRNDD